MQAVLKLFAIVFRCPTLLRLVRAGKSQPGPSEPWHHVESSRCMRSVMLSHRLAAFVFPFGMKIFRSAHLMCSSRIPKTSDGRAPVSCSVMTTSHEHFVRRSEEHTSELQSLRHLVCR